ncbi:MAG: T9SS type A sorting domain-containing protein, partial [Saprospiraceae bacterium]|nr:T9SS type A sorting domain-containing protein [Saprospiraceae bacterium]
AITTGVAAKLASRFAEEVDYTDLVASFINENAKDVTEWSGLTQTGGVLNTYVSEGGLGNFGNRMPNMAKPAKSLMDKQLSIFPNPISDDFQVQVDMNQAYSYAELLIFDQLGKLVYSKPVYLEKGLNTWHINQNFFPGWYYLSIRANKLNLKKTILKLD